MSYEATQSQEEVAFGVADAKAETHCISIQRLLADPAASRPPRTVVVFQTMTIEL